MPEFLRTRQWVIGRRLFLIAIIVILGWRQYGPSMVNRIRGPNPQRDITITRSEFRPELPGAKPAWILGFRNDSNRFTYDQIQLEATYTDGKGTVLETDKLVVKQKIEPGEEKIIGTLDFKSRGAATHGTVKLLTAKEVR